MRSFVCIYSFFMKMCQSVTTRVVSVRNTERWVFGLVWANSSPIHSDLPEYHMTRSIGTLYWSAQWFLIQETSCLVIRCWIARPTNLRRTMFGRGYRYKVEAMILRFHGEWDYIDSLLVRESNFRNFLRIHWDFHAIKSDDILSYFFRPDEHIFINWCSLLEKEVPRMFISRAMVVMITILRIQIPVRVVGTMNPQDYKTVQLSHHLRSARNQIKRIHNPEKNQISARKGTKTESWNGAW